MSRRFAPLRVRLPMTVALLLAVCTGVVVVLSYRAVRRSVIGATRARLNTAAERTAASLDGSLRAAEVSLQRIVRTKGVEPWLRTGSGDITAQLDSISKNAAQPTPLVLVAKDGRSAAAADSDFIARANQAPVGASPFFARGDTIWYFITAPLIANGDTLGRLTLARSLASGSSSALGSIIGPGAVVRVGNADGSLWTDLSRKVGAPAPASSTNDTLSASAKVPGMPWTIWVGQPRDDALEAVTPVLRSQIIAAALAVLIGAAVAWWLILRLTAPLDELAVASDAIARGDYQRRIARASTRDEVGRAAIAFNTMAGEIETHHRELETQVRERTSELEHALEDLREALAENVRKERLATLGHLAGSVGHELRNPLGVMTNAIYVLEAVSPDPNPMVRDYFGILKNQISLCEKIVADLLDYARTKPPSRAAVPLEQIARQQVERLGIVDGRVSIEWDFPMSSPVVDVDSVQIGQVVFNLVTNAVQAMGENGGALRLRTTTSMNIATLEVIDSGPGMAPDVAARVFEPMFTTKAKGLGLGLSVSRMLAENNGGALSFATVLGTGTTFRLTLPTAI